MSESLCYLCPSACGRPRSETEGTGACGMGTLPVIARAAPHFGEEPCLTGTRGSGAVFFSGCALRCEFCQNREISKEGKGTRVSVSRLREIFLELQAAGVHNLNLVTGSHFTPAIVRALQGLDLHIPVVWNTSGYENSRILNQLKGLVQIYMPDLKYAEPELARRFSRYPDYPHIAREAILQMYDQVGPYQLDGDGLLRSGVLIRHLVLPDHLSDTFDCIDWVAENFRPGQVLFSLMGQFTPVYPSPHFPELNRTLTQAEYRRAQLYLESAGIQDGYLQPPEAAGTELIPSFDGTGVER